MSPKRSVPMYADQVTYYGNASTKNAVIADKKKFTERWPQRKYDIRVGSLVARCEGGLTCTLEGFADWATFNPATMIGARGSAQLQYTVTWSASGPKISAILSVYGRTDSARRLGRELTPSERITIARERFRRGPIWVRGT